jgi:hypothetical protein
MTALFAGVHADAELQTEMDAGKPEGAMYDEILYADDAIALSMDPVAPNRLVCRIETMGMQYGLTFNNGK